MSPPMHENFGLQPSARLHTVRLPKNSNAFFPATGVLEPEP